MRSHVHHGLMMRVVDICRSPTTPETFLLDHWSLIQRIWAHHVCRPSLPPKKAAAAAASAAAEAQAAADAAAAAVAFGSGDISHELEERENTPSSGKDEVRDVLTAQ
jgi:hypothetical protein